MFKTRRPTILFLHLPKTAGISMRSVFFREYTEPQIFKIEPDNPVASIRQLKALPDKVRQQIKFVTGHTLWGAHYFVASPFLYVTMLRDPVERVLSSYSYIRSLPSHFLYEEMHARKMSLEDFLIWDKSQFEVENQQTKLLAGVFNTQKPCGQIVFKQASEHLRKYCLVGITEHFAESLSLFAHVLGLKNASVQRSNVTSKRLQRAEIPTALLERIRARNRYDLALYRQAKKLFAEALQSPQHILATKQNVLDASDENIKKCDFLLI